MPPVRDAWRVRKLIQHIVVFVAVNTFLIAIWVLVAGGSQDKLEQVIKAPADSVSIGFWPVFPLLAWGLFLVVHAAFAVPNMLLGDRAAKRRRQMAKHAVSTSKDIAQEVVGAIDKAHERRVTRQMQRDEREASARPAAPSRRWVTVMFCDVAGSTSHNERLGDEEWHRVLAHVRSVVRAALVQRRGNEVGTQGDGMLARFESPADAVLCGIDIQDELGQARETSDFVPEVRIGVHAGDALEEDGDLIGRVINLASRVTDEATPGEILVTEPVADQLVGSLTLEDKGLRPLKGISQPRHLLAVRWTDDGVQT